MHDLFLSHDETEVHKFAQNRRCNFTEKKHKQEKTFWEDQLALFQPQALKWLDGTVKYQLSTHKEANSDALETLCSYPFNWLIMNNTVPIIKLKLYQTTLWV